MTAKEARQLPNGLYILHWKAGGSSFASVGSLYDGAKWFAPTNWISVQPGGIASTEWCKVERATQIKIGTEHIS